MSINQPGLHVRFGYGSISHPASASAAAPWGNACAGAGSVRLLGLDTGPCQRHGVSRGRFGSCYRPSCDGCPGGRSHLLPSGSIHAPAAVRGRRGESDGSAVAVLPRQFASEPSSQNLIPLLACPAIAAAACAHSRALHVDFEARKWNRGKIDRISICSISASDAGRMHLHSCLCSQRRDGASARCAASATSTI